MTYVNLHSHSDFSNLRFLDSINTVNDLIDVANQKGLKGIALTDHASVAGHVDFYKYYKQQKKNGNISDDFKIVLGDEIYLIDKEKEKELKENNERIKYFHFILNAKDNYGLEGIRKIESKAWKNSYWYRGQQRVPSYKDEMKEIMKDYKGHIVAQTACLGSELDYLLLKYNNEKTESNWLKIDNFVKYCIEVFGKDDFYFELQPSHQKEQKIVNDMLLTLSKHYGIKTIVTTDAHYQTKEDKKQHNGFLSSRGEFQEDVDFYETTYIMSYEELLEYFNEDVLKELTKNTLEIYDKIEEYKLEKQTIIPKAILPEWEWQPKNYLPKVSSYENIVKMINSKYEMDHYYIKQVLDGIDSHPDTDWTDDVLSRIDLECSELIGLTEQLEQPMSSYFVLMRDLIDIMWTVSLVGPARGSASCWLTNYLIGITQVNALKFKLPHQRFLTKERVGSFPNINYWGSKTLQPVIAGVH